MNPDEMSDAQIMRMITLAIAAVSGARGTVTGLILFAEQLSNYIETGERPG